MLSTIITYIYLGLVGILVIYLISHLFRTEKIADKISIAVVLCMFILRLLLIK